ncbi:MAG: prepilin-type N-terminal cleavage/methylation domain-containing protein [Planctomycetota bacterium]
MKNRMKHSRRGGTGGQPPRAGYTLVEVLIVTSILAMIFLLVFSTTNVMTRASNAGRNRLLCLTQAEKAIHIIINELPGTSTRSASNYAITNGGSTLTFYRIQGYTVSGGTVVPTPMGPITYTVEGDQMVRLQDLSDPADDQYTLPGERRVLCNGVQSVQFAVNTGGLFEVSLTLAAGDAARNTSTSITKMVTIRPMNEFIR